MDEVRRGNVFAGSPRGSVILSYQTQPHLCVLCFSSVCVCVYCQSELPQSLLIPVMLFLAKICGFWDNNSSVTLKTTQGESGLSGVRVSGNRIFK